ncbi:hypothetical protein [Ignavibacterium sp.]|uniref:hypothetical protein n=1 Tax=Ignavibacterium sp. TaxID=2651167 RepID=UPI00307E1C6B
MKNFILYTILLLLLVFFRFNDVYLNVAPNQDTKFTAQIDILIYNKYNKIRLAKNNDKISVKDRFRIMLQTNKDAKVLILNKSNSICEMLFNLNLIPDYTYYLPDSSNFLSFDGEESTEEIFFVMINNQNQLPDKLFNPTTDCYEKYKIINQLKEEEFDFVSKDVPPLIQLSGNVRFFEQSEKILTNSSYILKKFRFNVQK